ncbi:mucin-12-like [Formica exsecta]|uniref:mucin-12-like n=1 Tax=Formica exsecta TaxID=72781 RepID=UPI001144643C|nr:mucin-12-like [Formica exsecta]
MWLKSVFLIYGVIACTLADSPSDIVQISGDNLIRAKHIEATTYQPPRAVKIEEFVTSHKLPGNIARPSDDDDEYFDEKKVALKDNKYTKKVIQKFENNEKKAILEPARRLDSTADDDLEILTAKRLARVELENFSDSGKVLQDEKIKKVDSKRPTLSEQDEVIPGVYVSAEYPTTMLPVLTTPREARDKDTPFDFVPVNIIREDSKDSYAHFSDANFGDLSDVSLVPAGTNSRIQVKKGPNGKDYEYEYVYYYYDEEDENKAGTAGSTVTNSYDIPSRTTSAPRRGGIASNRSKYNTVERSSTVEPSNNEVIPNKNGNRGRQLVETEDVVSEERLPANTRFPPRSRSNHNTGTTESSRARSNRPRPGLDLVDSSSFRTHQEGPEFPQTLPKGPVRFLGVTPNENNEEKLLIRNRGRPQRIQDPAPVEETIDDVPAPAIKRRPSTTAVPQTEVELSRGQPPRPDEEDDKENAAPEGPGNKHISVEDKMQESSETDSSGTILDTTDNPTTENPSIMDKIALDLYAFLQQGQNNLVDAFNSESGETQDNTTIPDDEITTDLATTTELAATTIVADSINTTTSTTTTTTTEPTTTSTTTTEPSTTTTQTPAGRGKFRRPGLGGPVVSRNRFKSNGGTSTSTEATASEPTQKSRGRFGNGSSNGNGFKRPRPGGNHKPIEEDTIQKETSSSVNAEKPVSGRGRFRAPSGGRIAVSTTTISTPSNSGAPAISNGAAAARPAFNKLNINRRRGRPTTSAPGGENSQEAPHSETGAQTVSQIAPEATTSTPKNAVRARLPGAPVIRPSAIRPSGGRVNLRQKPGQVTTTTTLASEAAEAAVEEPAGEGTEEETHEAPAETSLPPARSTTPNPLNKLRNRNRLQVHPKTTTKSPVPPAIRRSPLLPRRKVTEAAPAPQTSQEDTSSEEEVTSISETEPTSEATSVEINTTASTKHDETRGLGGLLAPRRRIPARRPGQIVQVQA